MESFNRKRTRNKKWTAEEKELLQKLISKSFSIIENKSTKSIINRAKINEWKTITKEFNRLLSKTKTDERTVTELKLAWRRIKNTSKENETGYTRQTQTKNGDGDQPFPSSEAPFEFTVNVNYDDSDEEPTEMDGNTSPYQEIKMSPSEMHLSDQNGSPSTNTKEEFIDEPDDQLIDQSRILYNNIMNNFLQNVVNSNEEFKRKHLELLEREHRYNIEIAKLKVKKLELEITLLTKEVKKKTKGTT